MRAGSDSGAARQAFGEAGRRNAEVIRALGMGNNADRAVAAAQRGHLSHQVGAGDVAATYAALSKVLRMVLQSAVLGLGAYLVIRGEATAGVMIAASILVSRALAPVEIAIANWRGFIAARQSFARLSQTAGRFPPTRGADEPAQAGKSARRRGAVGGSARRGSGRSSRRVLSL